MTLTANHDSHARADLEYDDGDRVLVHVQAEVRSVVHGRFTSVCGHRAVHAACDPRIFTDGPAVSS